jgi:ribulose-5-phosphate 4-epimerase/fuculose-1-phosphate aldolase
VIESTTMAARELRTAVARAVRILSSAGILGLDGQVGVRERETLWVNAPAANPATLTAHDVVAVDLTRTADDHHLLRAVFARRPDVHAVAWGSPEYVATLSLAGQALVPVDSIGSFLAETTPTYEDRRPITTAERAAALAETLGAGPAVVLRAAGLLVVAASVEEAVARLTSAEENARHQYRAALLGDPKVLRGAELAEVARENWPAIVVRKHWHYRSETARKAGAMEGVDE